MHTSNVIAKQYNPPHLREKRVEVQPDLIYCGVVFPAELKEVIVVNPYI